MRLYVSLFGRRVRVIEVVEYGTYEALVRVVGGITLPVPMDELVII